MWAHDDPRREEDRLHDHRQFGRREGSVSPQPATGQVSVRRAGGARPRRLAGVGMPPGNPLRCSVVSGHYDGGNEFFSDQRARRASFCPSTRWSASSCSGTCNGLFSQLKEVYLFGCNTLNAGRQQERIRRDRAKPGALRPFARRRRAAVAGTERAPRRKQPRSHAPGLQGRAGDLWLLVGGAARADGGFAVAALLPVGRYRRNRDGARERTIARRFRRPLDDRRERI